MKYWRCPECHRERFFEEDLVIKICDSCQVGMEVVEK